jgi:hypothetical protein
VKTALQSVNDVSGTNLAPQPPFAVLLLSWLSGAVTGMVESQVRLTTEVGLSYKMSDFTGAPVSESDLIRFLSQIRRSEMIRLIANMTATVSRDEWRVPAGQLEMARNVLAEEVWAKVKVKIASSGKLRGALFHRRQLWFLLQMALMVCSEDSPKLEPMEMQRRAAVAALMASDVLAQVDGAHTPEAWVDQGIDQWAATTLLPLRDQRPGGHILGRSICMWLDMQSDPIVKKRMKQIGITKTFDELFAAAHGLSLRDFICVLMTAYNVYERGTEETPPQIPLLDPAVMSGMPYSLESATKAISLAGIAPDALVTPRESWARDFSALYCKPLLEVLPGKYACADVGLFTLFFMDGIFDLLEECLSKEKFRDLFGTIFEQYINRVFSDFLYSGTTLVRQFAPSPKYVGENRQAADGVALLSGLTVLMEYKGGMLTKRQKYGGNIEETIKGLDGLLARFGTGKKGLGQLVENIERLLRGDKIHINNIQIDIPADRKIHPDPRSLR